MSEDILVSNHGRVAVITLNRPARLNAWTTAMREMIIDALQRFDADDNVAAIVMTGAVFGGAGSVGGTRLRR
jgi:enoyl-CoA hydratase/carnithine racemase